MWDIKQKSEYFQVLLTTIKIYEKYLLLVARVLITRNRYIFDELSIFSLSNK